MQEMVSFALREWWMLDEFNMIIHRVRENGLMKHLFNIILSVKDLNNPFQISLDSILSSVTFKDLNFLFFIYLFGMSVATIVFVLEVLMNK